MNLEIAVRIFMRIGLGLGAKVSVALVTAIADEQLKQREVQKARQAS
jgi:hypothetical protein